LAKGGAQEAGPSAQTLCLAAIAGIYADTNMGGGGTDPQPVAEPENPSFSIASSDWLSRV